MTKKWKVGLAAVAAALIIVVLLTEGVLIPKQLQPNVLPIRLLSVTATEGGRQAVYELRNESGSKVDVWAAADLNVGKPENYEIQEMQITPFSIEEGDAARISVIVPDEESWQIMLRVARHGAKEGTVVFSEWSTDR
jgi:hypothetical protein